MSRRDPVPFGGLATLTGPTVSLLLRQIRDALRAAPIDNPDLDARIILGHVLGTDLTGLVRAGDLLVEPVTIETALAAVRRRLSGEPVARILGLREFWGLAFTLSEATLVPRPDTETVVEVALSNINRRAAFVLADLGTGSGAILAAVLSECPNAFGVAVDISLEALSTARGNLDRFGLTDRAGFVLASFADALALGRFDLIVSNPPYIESDAISGLMPEVADHEPRLALDGGPDGLDAYRRIAGPALAALKVGGRIILEVGWRQSEAVVAILRATGFHASKIVPDLAGNPRVVTALKPF